MRYFRTGDLVARVDTSAEIGSPEFWKASTQVFNVRVEDWVDRPEVAAEIVNTGEWNPCSLQDANGAISRRQARGMRYFCNGNRVARVQTNAEFGSREFLQATTQVFGMKSQDWVDRPGVADEIVYTGDWNPCTEAVALDLIEERRKRNRSLGKAL